MKLTKAEEQIMKMLWKEDEPITVSQLIEKMSGSRPPHSTISSIIRILENKGFVDHKTYGRTHAYYSIMSRREYQMSSIKGLVSGYFHGSVNELVSFIVQENDLSLEDLTEIIEKVEKDQPRDSNI